MTGVVVLLVTLVLATGAGALYRARNGRMRTVASVQSTTATTDAAVTSEGLAESTGNLRDELVALGLEPGERGTLLQFSSAFCAPCRATRTLLADAAGDVPGVRHLEVDVADSDAVLELVRRLDIRRTPTTLVLDADGREVRRASGVPRRDQVLAALAGTVA